MGLCHWVAVLAVRLTTTAQSAGRSLRGGGRHAEHLYVHLGYTKSMYKRLVVGFLLLAGLVGVATPAAASTQDFTINSFVADYYINRAIDGVSEMRVREHIVAEFPGYDQNHGILRAIPQSYDGHNLELHIASVRREDGSSWQYTTDSDNGNTVLKIGDPDAYVRGQQTYIIEYSVRGPISATQGAQRLFWDVNGDQWQQQFREVTARIHVPAALADTVAGEPTCFTGGFGSTKADCQRGITTNETETIYAIGTTQALGAGETLTVELPFTQNTFAPYTASSAELARLAGLAALIALPPFASTWFMVRHWRKHGRDAKGRGVIVPQYLPPKGVSILGSSSVMYQGFRVSAISATIIDLAVRHYIKVYETGKKVFGGYKYDLELVKAPTGLLPEETRTVAMLFGSSAPAVGTRVSIEDLSKTLYMEAQKIGEDADAAATQQGYFAKNPTKARTPFIVAGVIIMICGVVFMPYTLGLLLAGIPVLIGGALMAAPTPKGAELKEYLLGLKKYMKLAEAERLAVLQSPQGRLTEKVDVADKGQLVKLYERLLPYAMMFGIEKEWSKQFADLYEQSPSWYSGSGTFNAVYFAGAMGSLDTAMTQSFSPPSSSSSGAGGGGGGGGGGGW